MPEPHPAHPAAEPTRTILARGARRRCPRCGRGPLFARWSVLRESCPSCGLVYEPSPGATWGFWVVGDRVFIVAALVPIYLGLGMPNLVLRSLFFAALLAAFFGTIPHRQGIAVALDYLTRVRWGDLSGGDSERPDESDPPRGSGRRTKAGSRHSRT